MRRALRPCDPRLWIAVMIVVGSIATVARADEPVRGYRVEVESCAPGRPCRPMPNRPSTTTLQVCRTRVETLRERLVGVRTAAGAAIAVHCATVPGLPRA